MAVRAETFAAGSTRSRSPREGLLLFGGVQALAFISVLVPAGPQRPGWFIAALGLTACAAALQFVTPLRWVPRWFQVAALLFATAAIGCLIHSAATSTGLGSLLLLPLLVSALYGAPAGSFVLVPA